MNSNERFYRAQVYFFLAGALLYPCENWLEDLPDLSYILENLGISFPDAVPTGFDLGALQEEYRHTLGLSGSIPYETEIGLPDEFRQSQEMADIAGFYRAFGFNVGGPMRERPDYLATELEYMGLLALKEVYAGVDENAQHVEVCRQASINFLNDHLGRWIGLFAEGLARTSENSGNLSLSDHPYLWLSRLAADFVRSDAVLQGADPQPILLRDAIPTPLGPELSCGDCPAAG